MKVSIYTDTSCKFVGDPEHLRVYATIEVAEAWLEQNGCRIRSMRPL
jgi:hypothetical protein